MTVMLAFHFADMLVAESALSFLGLGAPIGVPTWGNLLQESRDFLLIAPWLMAVPAVAIALLVITANLVGDGLSARDRQRGRRVES
jgi:peptide/nickel transport system permease protein